MKILLKARLPHVLFKLSANPTLRKNACFPWGTAKVFDGVSNRSPKGSREAYSSSPLAEAVPAESEVFCRSGCIALDLIRMGESHTEVIS